MMPTVLNEVLQDLGRAHGAVKVITVRVGGSVISGLATAILKEK